MKYDDWKDAQERLITTGQWLRKLSNEKFASYDLSREQEELTRSIEHDQKRLAEVKKLLKTLPEAPKSDGYILSDLVTDERRSRMRWSKTRKEFKKLYGYEDED